MLHGAALPVPGLARRRLIEQKVGERAPHIDASNPAQSAALSFAGDHLCTNELGGQGTI